MSAIKGSTSKYENYRNTSQQAVNQLNTSHRRMLHQKPDYYSDFFLLIRIPASSQIRTEGTATHNTEAASTSTPAIRNQFSTPYRSANIPDTISPSGPLSSRILLDNDRTLPRYLASKLLCSSGVYIPQ